VTRTLLAMTDDPVAQRAKRTRAEEAKAFEDLVQQSAPRLYRLAVRLTGSLEDAEDVLQESFLQAVSTLRGGRFQQRSSVETWLYRVVTHTALKLVGRRRKTSEWAQRTLGTATEPARAELRAELAVLSGWLDELPEEQRAALVLKELEGLTTAEIAQVLECTEGSVEQRLVRARATLRARYAG
jgi:RNA polymerase sigma-70 factor (ECF subfamily)